MPTGIYKRQPITDKHRKKLSISATGRKLSKETKIKISKAHKGMAGYWKGKKMPIELNKRKSKWMTGKVGYWKNKKRPEIGGKNSNFWKGGICPENMKIRTSIEYKLWRKAVFERDNFTCIWCGQKGGNLNADHIKPFALFPELRFAIDNGRTLCEDCHRKTPSYLNRWFSE